MVQGRAGKLDDVVDELIAFCADHRDELIEIPELAIEEYFGPVKVRPLPPASTSEWGSSPECSTDGYYLTELDPTCPIIIFDDTVSRGRQRYTLLHELGHHLVATTHPEVLDVLDDLAGDRGSPAALEEHLCQRFAAHVLLPTELVEATIGTERLSPHHVVELWEQSQASWQACAMRAAETILGAGAVVLVRDPGEVWFCASSPARAWQRWDRHSPLQPTGPLELTTRGRSLTAVPEIYRYDQSYAEPMWADTKAANGAQPGIGVLTSTPSRDRPNTLFAPPEPEPVWKTREDTCPICDEPLSVDWCDECSSQRCPSCHRCRCQPTIAEWVCENCGLLKGPGARVPGHTDCRDCLLDTGQI